MSAKYQELLTAIEESKQHAEKFFVKGVSAAGTRLRKSLQDIKKLSQSVREDVQIKKAESVETK